MIWFELAVAGETVQQSLYVRLEHSMECWIVRFIKMFSQTVPEVEGDFNHLEEDKDSQQTVK